MEINADFSERVVLLTDSLPWVPSPLPGVERRMLDRIGAEVARATSIVRYAPESFFDPHVHGGGEEFLVLDGVFSDEHGDYGPGAYVRNPPGSRHRPFSRKGCVLFVKLWQMDPEDRAFVRIDTVAAPWQETDVAGIEVMHLFEGRHERVSLIRFRAGAVYPREAHAGGEEILVLDGILADDLGTYPRRSWIRNPPGSLHPPFSGEGCTAWIKTGHLAAPPRAPSA